MKHIYFIGILTILLTGCSNVKKQNTENPKEFTIQRYQNKNFHKVNKVEISDSIPSKVKNIILMIGDGMGLNVIQAAWVANKGALNLENATHTGFAKTTCSDTIITDSAASGTAMATGQKTNKGYVGVDATGNSLNTICEYAQKAGKATGVLSTCRIYDATPATFSVENIDRNDSEAIALSYVDANIDFVLGEEKMLLLEEKTIKTYFLYWKTTAIELLQTLMI